MGRLIAPCITALLLSVFAPLLSAQTYPTSPIQGCVLNTQGTAYTCEDQGLALAQIHSRRDELQAHGQAICVDRHGAGVLPVSWQWRIDFTTGAYQLNQRCTRTRDGQSFSWGASPIMDPDRATFSNSCSTRPHNFFDNPGDQSGTVCYQGCRYTILFGEGYSNQYLPDGSTCTGETGNLEPPDPVDPPDPDPPDPDPDDPDPLDPDPDDPDPPDPDEPDEPEEPEEPEEPDPNEPNQPGQNVDMSGVESRLDALKQSVDVIPPKLDAIADAIARAGRCVGRGPGDGVVDECDNMASENPEGNTVSGGGDCTSEPVCTGDQAQCAMVLFAWRNQCATERVADALEGNSDGEPGTPEPGPDLSEYAQDPSTDGLVESIWQDAQDGEMELDTAGFGGSRSCPLLSLNIPAWMGTPNFSAVCNVMSFLANLFFAIAAVWGLAIVWRK